MNKKCAGFSLIEILVSVLVLSIGMLGAAGMQLTAMRTVQESGFRTFALQLAVEAADQIQASRQVFSSGNPANSYLQVNYRTDQAPELPHVMCFSSDANCLVNDLARFHIYEWERRVKSELPNGRIVICMDSAPFDVVANAYKWECTQSSIGMKQIVIKLGWQGRNIEGGVVRNEGENAPPAVVLVVGT